MNTLEQSLQRVYGLQEGGPVVQDMMMRPGEQMPPQDMMQRGPVSEEEIDMMVDDAAKDMTEEEKQILEDLLERGAAIQESPLAAEVQELKQYGEGPDTELAHLRPGEMVIPPEFLEDAQFESALAKKFDEFDINPEQAIVGSGIASLNPVTGLEQFFFKKIGKALKKVVKKIAPIAGPLANFIPGVGPVLAGAIGAGANVAAGKGLKGALSGALGGYGAGKLFGGVGSLGKAASAASGAASGAAQATGIFGGTIGPSIKAGIGSFFKPAAGQTGIFGGQLGPNIRRGIGSIFTGGPQGLQPGNMPGQVIDTGEVIGTLDGQPVTRADLANMDANQIGNMQMTQAAVNDKTLMQRLSAKFLPQGVENVLGTGPGGGGIFGGGQGQGGGGGLFGGGFGDALKVGGIGALAAGLGKLAYEDAKKQKGVPLTPLTTMSPTGRYNIEAEISRRMGQQAPNPVEFGLLPEGTIPELSGGKPREMMYGGAVEDLTGGMAMGLQEGGSVNKMRALGMQMKVADNQIDSMVPFRYETGAVVNESALPPGGFKDKMIQALLPESIEDKFRSDRVLDFEDAAMKFTSALLKKESGAVITDSEVDWVMRTYMPQPGDNQSTIERKSEARKMAIQSVMPEEKPKSKGIGSMPMMMYGGPVMAYAEGGAVQMQEGGEMDPSMFPRMDGDINGPGTETSDDIPAMLSDGEFVMTGQAVRGAGTYDMKNDSGILTLTPSNTPSRDGGTDLMYKLMEAFASQARPA